MSTQINQYAMWGIRMPYEWHEQWEMEHHAKDEFYDRFEDFMADSQYKSEVSHKDGIYCLFDGRDGRFIIIGRVLAKAKDGDLLGAEEPLEFGELTPLEQELIANSVQRNFGVTGKFQHWFVTVYR